MGQKLTTPRLRQEAKPFRGVSLSVCDGVLDSWYACAEGYFVSKSECFAIVRRSGLLEILESRLVTQDPSSAAEVARNPPGPPSDVGFWTRSDLLSTGDQGSAAERSVFALFGALATPRGKMDILHLLVPLVMFAEAERVDRLKMLFKCWDVTGNGKLSPSEVVHAFKVSVTGLVLWEAAVPSTEPHALPASRDLEAAALSVMLHGDEGEEHVVLEKDLLRFSRLSPDAKSWLDAYDTFLAQNSRPTIAGSPNQSLFLRRQLRSLHERPPKRKLQSSLTFVAEANTLVVFGGYSGPPPRVGSSLAKPAMSRPSEAAAAAVTADVAIYRLRPALVERIRPVGQQPPPRAAHAHCCIQGNAISGALYFGGVGKGEMPLNDVWFLWHVVQDEDESGTAGSGGGQNSLESPTFAWQEVTILGGRGPTPRRHATMVQVSPRLVVVYGGLVTGKVCNDIHVLESLSDDWSAAQWQTVRMRDDDGNALRPPPLCRPVMFRTVDQTGRLPLGALTIVVFGGAQAVTEKAPEDQRASPDDEAEITSGNSNIWTLCLVDQSAAISSPRALTESIPASSPVVSTPLLETTVITKVFSVQWLCSAVDGVVPTPREGAVASQPISIEREDAASGLGSPSPLSPSPLSPSSPLSPGAMSPMLSPMMRSPGSPMRSMSGKHVFPSPIHRQNSKSAMKKAKEERKLIQRQKTMALNETKVWIFGGYDPNSKGNCSDLWELCCRAGRWESRKVFDSSDGVVTALSSFVGPKLGDLVVLHEPKTGRALSAALTPWVLDGASDVPPRETFAPCLGEVTNAPKILEMTERARRGSKAAKAARKNPRISADAKAVRDTEIECIYGWSSGGLRRRDTVKYHALGGTSMVLYPAASCCVVLSKIWTTLKGMLTKKGKFRELDDAAFEKHLKKGGTPEYRPSLSLSQKRLLGHDGNIIAIATLTNDTGGTAILATAQDGPRARVLVWDASTMKCRGVLKDAGVSDVRHLSFSPGDGLKLLALSVNQSRGTGQVSIYDWKKLQVIFTTPICSGAPPSADIIAVSWVHERMFATCADEQVTLWNDRTATASGVHFQSQAMLYGVSFKRTTHTCLAPLPLDDFGLDVLDGGERLGVDAVDRVVSGTTDGCIYVWAGTFCKDVVRAHDGSVVALRFMGSKSLLVTSGLDRFVRLWAPDLGCLSEISMDAVVCSIDLAPASSTDNEGVGGGVPTTPRGSTTTLLLATTDGAICERRVSDGRDPNGRVLVQGHSAGGVNAIDVNVKKGQVVTVGDDATLCLWNTGSLELPWRRLLSLPSHACCFTPKGDQIVVGLGTWRDGAYASAATGRTFEYQDTGTIWLINNRVQLDKAMALKVGTAPISAIAFSPVENKAIIGLWNERLDNSIAEAKRGETSSVVLYENAHDKNGWNNRRVARGISNGICACDISADGVLVRLTTLNKGDVTLEMATLEPWKVLSEADAGSALMPPMLEEGDEEEESEEEDAEETQEAAQEDNQENSDDDDDAEERPEHLVEWATQKSFCGGHMRYAWQDPTSDGDTSSSPPRSDGVTTTDRSVPSDSDQPQLVVTGHRSGALRVWRAQCDFEGVRPVPCSAFSSAVACVKVFDSENIVSVLGGSCAEGCVVQWRTLPLVGASSAEEDITSEKLKTHDISRTDPSTRNIEELDWVAAPPSSVPDDVDEKDEGLKSLGPEFFDPPECDVSLRYVHGFSPGAPTVASGRVLCTADDRLVYAVAAVVVIMDTKKPKTTEQLASSAICNSQVFFQSHSSDVTALALHPNKMTAASGQAGEDPVLFVWDTATSDGRPRTLRRLQLLGQTDIVALSFSVGGDTLATASSGSDRAITVIDWRHHWVQFKVSAGPFAVKDLRFIPEEDESIELSSFRSPPLRLLQVGDQHFGTWTISGGAMAYQRGLFILRKTAGEEEYEEQLREAERKTVAEEQRKAEEAERRAKYGGVSSDEEDENGSDGDRTDHERDDDDDASRGSDQDSDEEGEEKSPEEIELKRMSEEEETQRSVEKAIAQLKAETEAKRLAEEARIMAEKKARIEAEMRMRRKTNELAEQQRVTCVDMLFMPGDDGQLQRALLGTSDGWLHIVDMNRVKVIQSVPAGTDGAAVDLIIAEQATKSDKQGGFYTSGRDGVLRRWSGFGWDNVCVDPIEQRYEMRAKGEQIEEHALGALIGEGFTGVEGAEQEAAFDLPPRASDVSNVVCLRAIGYRASGRLVVGTNDGRVVQLNAISDAPNFRDKDDSQVLFDDTTTPVVTHTALHSRGATSAIAADPTSQFMCSIGYGDKMVRLWDIATNTVVSCLDLSEAIELPEDVHPTSCCFSADGQLLVVGLDTSHQFPPPPPEVPVEEDDVEEGNAAPGPVEVPDDATEPTENSSIEAASSFSRSRTNTFMSDDDDRSGKGSNAGSDDEGEGDAGGNDFDDEDSNEEVEEPDRPGFVIIALTSGKQVEDFDKEEEKEVPMESETPVSVSMHLIQSPVCKATQLTVPCATKRVLFSKNGQYLAIATRTSEAWREPLNGVNVCGVSVVDEWGKDGRAPAHQVPGTDLAGGRKHAATLIAAVAARSADGGDGDEEQRKWDEEEKAEVFVRSESELAELHIERLGLVSVGEGAEEVISMDFSEDSQFLRFASSRLLPVTVESEKDVNAKSTAEPAVEDDNSAAEELATRRRTQINVARLATLELMSAESDMMDIVSTTWAAEDCGHDALLSSPNSGRSAWLPKDDIASPACAVACPGVVAMGVRVRVNVSSSEKVIDTANAGLRLFRRPCASTYEGASLQTSQHGQTLRIRSLAYSEASSSLVSLLSTAAAAWSVAGPDSSSSDGAVFVWDFKDQRTFDESGTPKPLNVQHVSEKNHVLARTYDFREDSDDPMSAVRVPSSLTVISSLGDGPELALDALYGLSPLRAGNSRYGTGSGLIHCSGGGVTTCDQWSDQRMVVGHMDGVIGQVALSADERMLAVEAQQIATGESIVNIYPVNGTTRLGQLSAPALTAHLNYLEFSTDGDVIMTIGSDARRTVNIFASLGDSLWTSSERLVSIPVLNPAISFLVRVPSSTAEYGNALFATGSNDEICFWSLGARDAEAGSTPTLSRFVGTFDEMVLDKVLVVSKAAELLAPKQRPPKGAKNNSRVASALPEDKQMRNLSCAVTYRGAIVTGSESGHLLLWCGTEGGLSGANSSLVSVRGGAKAHRGGVAALAVRDVGGTSSSSGVDLPIVSASLDGEVKLWQFPDFTPMRSISLMTAVVESLRPKDEGPYAVTSLSLHALGNRAMVSTRKGAAYEVSIWSGLAMPLLAGHTGEELWGLSAHPTDPNVAVSCGEEGSLCKWDLAGRCLDRRVDLKRSAHCCRFSPEGNRVAVGCFDGSVLIVHSQGLTTVQTIKARSTTAMRVTDLVWADDSTWLIGTNKDGTVVVYRSQDDTNPKFAAVSTVKASSSGLQPLRVDISADAKVLRCCSAGGARTAFFKTWGAKPVPETEAEGITWRSSASCPSAIELRDMRKRCRAVNCEMNAEEEEKDATPQLAMCVHVTARSKDGRFVAFGDARGVIHLFEEDVGTYRSIVAHACHITALDFNADGTLLLSAGSPDLCVKQWKLL